MRPQTRSQSNIKPAATKIVLPTPVKRYRSALTETTQRGRDTVVKLQGARRSSQDESHTKARKRQKLGGSQNDAGEQSAKVVEKISVNDEEGHGHRYEEVDSTIFIPPQAPGLHSISSSSISSTTSTQQLKAYRYDLYLAVPSNLPLSPSSLSNPTIPVVDSFNASFPHSQPQSHPKRLEVYAEQGSQLAKEDVRYAISRRRRARRRQNNQYESPIYGANGGLDMSAIDEYGDQEDSDLESVRKGRKWRTLSLREPSYPDDFPSYGPSYSYALLPPTSPLPPLPISSTHHPVPIGPNLKSFNHSRYPTCTEYSNAELDRRNVRESENDDDGFSDESQVLDFGLGQEHSEGMEQVLDEETDDLEEFVYWDETLHVDQDDDVMRQTIPLHLGESAHGSPPTQAVPNVTTISSGSITRTTPHRSTDSSMADITYFQTPSDPHPSLTTLPANEPDSIDTTMNVTVEPDGKGRIHRPMPLELKGVLLQRLMREDVGMEKGGKRGKQRGEKVGGEKGKEKGKGKGKDVGAVASMPGKNKTRAKNLSPLKRGPDTDAGETILIPDSIASDQSKSREISKMKAILSPFVLRHDGGDDDDATNDPNIIVETSVLEERSMDPTAIIIASHGLSSNVQIPIVVDEQDRTPGPEPLMAGGLTTSPEPMQLDEVENVTVTEQVWEPTVYTQIQDLLTEPHTLPVPSDYHSPPPPSTVSLTDQPIHALPSFIPHPFHPDIHSLIHRKPYMRVKWIIPVHGEVEIPGMVESLKMHVEESEIVNGGVNGGGGGRDMRKIKARDMSALAKSRSKDDRPKEKKEIIPTFVPCNAILDLPHTTTSLVKKPSKPKPKLKYPQPKTIRWTRRLLLEFWLLLLVIRKRGSMGPISMALSGGQPDECRGVSTRGEEARHLVEHLYTTPDRSIEAEKVQNGSRNPHQQSPKRPILGIHIKLFCDLKWALKLRYVVQGLRFGTTHGDGLLRESKAGEPLMEEMKTKEMGKQQRDREPRDKCIFKYRKLCLLGERGEVLIVA